MPKKLQSSHLDQHGYDPATKTLTIQFTNQAVYQYLGVPQTKADALAQSQAPGVYFHAKIKGNYPVQQIVGGVKKERRY